MDFNAGATIAGVSGILWKSGGSLSCHSKEVGIWDSPITPRCAENASHRIKMKNKRATNETIEPIEEITFHLV